MRERIGIRAMTILWDMFYLILLRTAWLRDFDGWSPGGFVFTGMLLGGLTIVVIGDWQRGRQG